MTMYAFYWNGHPKRKSEGCMLKKIKANQQEKVLNKTQEVLYQKEFKNADRVYNQLTQRGNRS